MQACKCGAQYRATKLRQLLNEPIITRCAYAQGRVKRSSPSICIMCVVCVSAKNTAVCCLTTRKSPRNSSLPLGLAIYILRKMPRKPGRVFCRVLWPWVSNSCTVPRGIKHYGNWVCRPTTSLRERWRKTMQIGSRQELGCGTESRSIPAQSKPTTC